MFQVYTQEGNKELTKTLVEIGRLNGIEMLDHIIVSDNSYFSFCENKLMENFNEI